MFSLLGAALFFLLIYGFVGFMAGMMASLVFMEMDLDNETDLAVASGVLWPIAIPVLVVFGVYKALTATYFVITDAFGNLWDSYVNRIEDKVR